MRRIFLFSVIVFSFYSISTFAAEVQINRVSFLPHDDIEVTIANAGSLDKSAWIGIIPSEIPHGSARTNDRHDVAYRYLEGAANVVFTFKAPKPGNYDLRLNDKVGSGKEVASISFKVKEREAGKVVLTPRNEKPIIGNKLVIDFDIEGDLSPKAWIALVRSDVPHGDGRTIDRHDIDYKYLNGTKKGSVELDSPREAGSYDIRLVSDDPDGRELKSVQIMARHPNSDNVRLTLNKTKFTPGESISLDFLASEEFSKKAWIGMLPAKIQHGTARLNDRHDLDWRYMNGKLSGTLNFTAPNVKGLYDFRMHDSYYGNEVTSIKFEVTHSLDSSFMREKIEKEGKITLQGIYFDTDKAEIRIESFTVLDNLGTVLVNNQALTVRIEGHTDNQGNEAHNLALSQNRAESVKSYLVNKFSLNPQRIKTKGFGESRPLNENETAYERSLNRRVEVIDIGHTK